MSSFWGCTGKTYFNVVNRISSDVHLKYLAHYLFSALLDCCVSISRTICVLACLTVTLVSRALFVLWFVWLLRWYLAHYLFSVCLTVTLVSRALFVLCLFDCYVGISHTICSLVCLTVTLVSRALFVLCLFDCYVSISHTICSLACLTVTLVSRALFVLCLFDCYIGILRTICPLFVWLLRLYLAHYLFSI